MFSAPLSACRPHMTRSDSKRVGSIKEGEGIGRAKVLGEGGSTDSVGVVDLLCVFGRAALSQG